MIKQPKVCRVTSYIYHHMNLTIKMTRGEEDGLARYREEGREQGKKDREAGRKHYL